jgi:sortase A
MRRRIGFYLLGLGIALTLWVGVVLVWGDPFTSLYTWYEQGKLSHQLNQTSHVWEQRDRVNSELAGERSRQLQARETVATLAERSRTFAAHLTDGQPIGRIVIPKIGLKMIIVEGTNETDLEKGPGHYDASSGVNTSLPGAGGVIAIAGHRTTYLHPFRLINELQPGDNVYLEMPYGTFRYTIYYHKVVLPTDWSILRHRPFEKLVLTACHPLYSASHRWATFARLEGESLKSELG